MARIQRGVIYQCAARQGDAREHSSESRTWTNVVDICYFWKSLVIRDAPQNNRQMESVQFREVMIVGEVAELLRVSRCTFEALCERGEGPPSFFIGSKRLWRRDDVFRWIKLKFDDLNQKTNGEPPSMT